MKDRVYAAADELAAQGKTPTLELVRNIIGGGSFTTIGPFLKAWKAENPKALPRDDADPVPDGIAKITAELSRRVWADAQELAGLGLEAARRDLEELKAEAAAEASELAAELARVEADRDAHAGQVQTLTSDLSVVAAELDAHKAELRVQTEARSKAESQVEAAKQMILSHEREMSGLYERLTATDDRLREMTDLKGKAEREAAKAQSELMSATARIGDLEAALTKAEARADRAEARAEKAEAKADAVQAELTKTGADLATARADLATERAQHVATRDKLGERLERVAVDHEAAEDRANALAAELAQIKKSEKG